MARRKKAVTGLTSELKAQLRLAEDPNLLVFVPLGGLGPVDIVTLNMTTGEYSAYDVKSKKYLGTGSSGFGVRLILKLIQMLENSHSTTH